MSEHDTPTAPIAGPFDWSVEASRTALERSLEAQQRAVDAWVAGFAPWSVPRSAEATPAQGVGWLYDVWSETLQNALVHLDDAVDEGGVDLDALQTSWLHALDDAVTDVGKRPTFAATMTRSVERSLTARYWTDELRRGVLADAGMATDRDVERLGERLLALEYRQKAVEAELDAVRAAVGAVGAVGAASETDRERTEQTEPAGDA